MTGSDNVDNCLECGEQSARATTLEPEKTDAQKRLDSIQRSLGNYVGNVEAIKARAARPRGRRRFTKKPAR